ncbi:MAG: phenylalanine--tRNA ligase subunit beta [Geminocystis sp.]|nr:phenylalanine--tRNA ligase subunit beta [Geminocystis sp.]HIK38364.1 phenylalanine--tRNA ligase subunit beta [Geminocystis sp. M7585_C2015_104]MCS7147706.1 phenylalanine--tRNA ligase subunit beta [Geminocystis sp.]MCX8079273.1 phenylalanine--tRNA ligase subunit beta [Geminocystis sp.]MDW8116719.1 phenylalanine--tRNA ligase subunit beta [Geminocystis sp.]
MRISLNWLREFVEVKLSAEELAKTLTIAGFEVEDIEDRRTWADGVVVGKVLECKKHPNADKLSVCRVDIGEKSVYQIVCGASNVRENILVAVAKPGSYLPKVDLKIKPTKLRGVESNGMICSLAELGLEKESEGIHILEGDYRVGEDIRPILGLDDVILEVTATANRADALSVVGVAREVAALTGGKLTLPHIEETINPIYSDKVAIRVEDTSACPAYIATIIEKVKIAPSPDWLQRRLQAAGIRPINNVVDATNYILLEWGQPLHAFDKDKLHTIAKSDSLTVGVRFAKEGETLTTLDSQERKLTPQNLLITINNQPVALAGVMGGEDSEVDENTQNILLEAALFEPVVVRRSAKIQGIRTESSTRYERGVNQVELEKALNRAISLINQLAGGKVTSQIIADNRSYSTPVIELRLQRLHQVLGKVRKGDSLIDIPPEDVVRILEDLGCQLEVKKESPLVWQVRIPPYRYRDLEREIDLIEEVARLYGYDNFHDTLPTQATVGYLPLNYQIQRQIRASLRGLGLTELMHYSLVNAKVAGIKIANPLFVEYSGLRSNLIDGLIDAFEYNLSQGNGCLNGFEIGRIFWLENGEKREADALGGIFGGDLYTEGIWVRSGKPQPMTWYEAKGILDSFFDSLKLPITYQAESDDCRLHPGRTASLWLNGNRIGVFGQLHPRLRQQKDLPDSVYVFELQLEPIVGFLEQKHIQTPVFKPYSTYPAVERDIAFFISTEIPVAEIVSVMRKAGGRLLADVRLFDEYKGENVEEGKRSLAFTLTYRSPDGTLKDSDVEPIHDKIRQTLGQHFDIILRS